MPVGNLNHKAWLNQKARPSRQNLLRLCLIRSIVIVALLAVSFWFRFYSTVSLPWRPLFLILFSVVLINGMVVLRLRSDWPVSGNEFFANLLLDVVFLTLVLYFTGGSTNPFVNYYLIPLIISAAVLPAAHTWFIAFLSIAFYTLLLFYYQPLGLPSAQGHDSMMSAHFVGMWVNFGFSALLIAWFVVRMAGTLREQAQAIAGSREAGLRNEQIISVASIAAGTAHEMRTPLATMAVTVDEIGAEHPELEEDIDVLRQQIERCDAVLRELVSTTTEDSRMVVTDVAVLLKSLLEKWCLARPEIELKTQISRQASQQRIRYDQSLQHALMNFLNNAADASPGYVALQVEADLDSVVFIVEDHGPGIPAEIADQLGKAYISRKQGGLGLGVLLSQASVERLGGEVTLTGVSGTTASGQGTRLEIRLPLLETSDSG